MTHVWLLLYTVFVLSLGASETRASGEEGGRPSIWIDLYEGEPTTYEAILEDVRRARVIYLGEAHTLQRHHDLQAKLVADLARRGVPLALGLEQLEARQQPIVDRFNRKEIGFDKLAQLAHWAERWPNYQQYRPVLEAARKADAPIIALNASPELIHDIARGGGVDKLPASARQELPADMQLKDPLYEKLLRMRLMVHMAATPELLGPMIEAQIARDEVMAATLAGYLNSESGRKRTVVVLCGAGHVNYGLGMAERVRRRVPGLVDRIVLLSQSGDVELTPAEKAQARDVEITHEQLREIPRPVGDYLHVTALSPDRRRTTTSGPEMTH